MMQFNLYSAVVGDPPFYAILEMKLFIKVICIQLNYSHYVQGALKAHCRHIFKAIAKKLKFI
jgi:hypothetical protein